MQDWQNRDGHQRCQARNLKKLQGNAPVDPDFWILDQQTAC
jgi:hypothetical protein